MAKFSFNLRKLFIISLFTLVLMFSVTCNVFAAPITENEPGNNSITSPTYVPTSSVGQVWKAPISN